MSEAIKESLSQAVRNGLRGFVSVERVRDAMGPVQPGEWAVFHADGRLMTSGYPVYADPFYIAADTIHKYGDINAAAVVFSPLAEDCPASLRETEGIVDTRDWQRFAIARFEWKRDDEARQINEQMEQGRRNLKQEFRFALNEIGVPVADEDICLETTHATDDPATFAQCLPYIQVDDLLFIYAYGDGRQVQLLDNPNDLRKVVLCDLYGYDVIESATDLGQSLYSRQLDARNEVSHA